MTPRRSRAEQTRHNRDLVLAAARRVFLARGYHASTLDQIAEEAGFSKGVVYSQFESKADLFLALLDLRIAERAERNRELTAGLAGNDGVRVLVEEGGRRARAEPEWGLLVIEFRVHAARNPQLNARYADAHERTVDQMAAALADLYERAGTPPPHPPRTMAELLLAIGAGVELEQAATADAFQGARAPDLLASLLLTPAADVARG